MKENLRFQFAKWDTIERHARPRVPYAPFKSVSATFLLACFVCLKESTCEITWEVNTVW